MSARPLMFLLCSILVGSGIPAPAGEQIPPKTETGERLVDINGTVHQPAADGDTTAIVFVYVDTTCPIANFYQPTLRRLAGKFEPRGVRFFQIHPDPDGQKDSLARHAREFNVISPVILDDKQRHARRHQAKVTPEAHVYLPDGSRVYRGRIDDTYATYGKRRPQPTTHDLEDALTATLSGKKVANPATKAVGCQILLEQ